MNKGLRCFGRYCEFAMQELRRKWWKRRRRESYDDDDVNVRSVFSNLDDDSRPIDTQEQEEMVRSFEKASAQQSRFWRTVFAGFLLGYAAFLIYAILQQVWYPWELRFHAYFMYEIHPWIITSADLMAVLACLLAVKGLLHNSTSYQQWMWYSCYTGLSLAAFWLYYMMRLSKFRWDIIWLPFGPLSGAGICLYVDSLLAGSLQEIERLRSRMYNYKSL